MTVRLPDQVAQFCGQLRQAHAAQDAQGLLALCPISPSHGVFRHLRTALKGLPEGCPSAEDIARVLPEKRDSDEQFMQFLADLMRHVRAIKDPRQARSREEFADTVAGMSKSFATVYGFANRMYRAYPHTGHLNPLMVALAKELISLSTDASRAKQDARMSIIEAAAASIEKTFRECVASEQNEQNLSSTSSRRGDGIWALGSILLRLYLDKIDKVVRADAIYAAFLNLRPSEAAHLAAREQFISIEDVVSSWYYRGKLQLQSGRLALATEFLSMAWERCPRHAVKNLRAILVPLIPCNILMGRFPSPILLRMFDLGQYFLPLIFAIKTGNRGLWVQTIEQHTEWYRSRGIWLILRERGEVLVMRTIFRRSQEHPEDRLATQSQAPTWIFLTAMRLAYGDDEDIGEIEPEDVICLLASLIDQGYVTGRISYAQTTVALSMKAGTVPGFARVIEVKPRALRLSS